MESKTIRIVDDGTAVKRAETWYRALFEEARDAILVLELPPEGPPIIRDANTEALRMHGYSRGELIGKPISFLDAEDDSASLIAKRSRRLQGTEGAIFEVRYRRKDGSVFVAEASVRSAAIGGKRLAIDISRDITERKKAEAYGEMGREVLQILNESGDLRDSIRRVIAALKTRTGFDAVGIRLQDGDDFPYFAQKGFSKDFLLTENTLVERAAGGGLCRDRDGNAYLECTCGLIISGKTDPANPLFTPGGSFWTNDSLPLLDIPPGEDPRLHPRNLCIHQNYASVALIPIRNRDRIVGLIQLNDRCRGGFSRDTVELMEGIASHIGAALMRKRVEESLRESEEALRAMLSEKKVLLKEVHHRVKNNLQVMSSLISLQADSLSDERLQGVLSDVRGRIITMALMHEKLYQTDDLAKLNFGEYAASLLQYLWRAHGSAAEKVRLNMSFAPLILPAEMAVHCGLILNELASNAIKHAFPSGTESGTESVTGCEVSVALDHDPATGAICLRVSDNGVGLPADLEWRQSSSLGLRLVQMLAGQMRGSVQLGPGSDLGLGTEFQVNFKA